MKHVLYFLTLAVVLCLKGAAASDPENVNFSRQILPILSDKCFVCHGPDAADSDADVLRLDVEKDAVAERDAGRAIDRDAPDKSLLLQRIHSSDNPMPPADSHKQLTADERRLLSAWVHQGGTYSKHWAFIPPQKAAVPKYAATQQRTADDTKVAGSDVIDAFIHQRLQSSGIDFAPAADGATLARRAALVLTGLPPEPEMLQRYLQDDSADAYDNLIDELLASPRFGEHQARYWLDAVRYGDTHGLHLDNRRGIYPYRDWVVRALNDNLPLDQFLTWQLAGDLLPNATLEQQVATGFVRMNPSTSEGGAIPDEFQAKNNFDRTETLGTVLLGISLNCARCHTHKYDPIQHAEYYQLLAFFNSTAESPMDGNKYEYGPVVQAPAEPAQWDVWRKLNNQQQQLIAECEQQLPQTLQTQWSAMSAHEKLLAVAAADGAFAGTASQSTAAELAARTSELQKQFTTTLVAKELPTARTTFVLRRGEYNLPIGEPVTPGVPAVLGALPKNAPANRLGLAQWLTSSSHPTVSRVLVNSLWQRVFGAGLVRTPEDFGVQGQQPTHPELLDWLAVELQDCGWNLKRMLKLMVTSRTFRQSSAWRRDVDDPQNQLWARASSYRLDAEVLRDLGLWASRLLDPAMGGEGVKPYQPDGMWLAMAHPASNTKKYERDVGKKLYRRSLYVYWKRTSPHPMMTLFDAPDRETSCVRRSRTNTSLQSLGLLNETQRIEMSRHLAQRLLTEQTTDEQRINQLFLLLTCRPADEAEHLICQQLLADMRQRYQSDQQAAAALLEVGDAKVSSQLQTAEAAAWSQLCTTILASDAAILLY